MPGPYDWWNFTPPDEPQGGNATGLAWVPADGFHADAPMQLAYDGTLRLSVRSSTIHEPGVMTASDKRKLDGIAAGSTRNLSDNILRDRGNHTSTQPESTLLGIPRHWWVEYPAVDWRSAAFQVPADRVITAFYGVLTGGGSLTVSIRHGTPLTAGSEVLAVGLGGAHPAERVVSCSASVPGGSWVWATVVNPVVPVQGLGVTILC